MTENMGLVQAAFLDDPEVLLISHSVTPNQDSVEVLKEYANAKGVVSGKWHLVTGNRSEIYRLGRENYFVEEDLGRLRISTGRIVVGGAAAAGGAGQTTAE